MKPVAFEYADPRSVDEALELLAEHGDDAKILAGGQSLVPMLNFRLARPRVIVDVNRIHGLDGLREADGVLHVGALVRQRTLERWAATRAPLLAAALRVVGHVAIRTRGTVGGSIAHADPAAELPALLLCHDGGAVVRSARGERVIGSGDFFRGPLLTALAPDELVTLTRWPLPTPSMGWGFQEVARRHGDFALTGAATLVALEHGRIASSRIVIFGAGPTPTRASDAEKALTGRSPTPSLFEEAGQLAAASVEAASDIHASAAYRRRVAATLVSRALAEATSRVRETTR
jgi:carbon-monoxide dehydrogenase medium subunit